MEEKIYPREKYLKRIRPFYYEYDLIKVLTGVRRCGKSTILSSIREELLEHGVHSENIIYLNLDSLAYHSLKTPHQLEKKILSLSKGIAGKKFLFIDEAQNIKNYETVINAFRDSLEYSIFLTGSNSYLLSGELVTKLTGRYLEFDITTLTFDEYVEMKRFYDFPLESDLNDELIKYLDEGGFPRALFFSDPMSKKTYLASVIEEIYQKDIKNNKKIRDHELFDNVRQFIINNFGATISIVSLCDSISKNGKRSVRRETVYRYLQILENLKIVSKCSRFDLKSKRALKGEVKYYLSDLAFYYQQNTDNRIIYGPALENILFNYAKASGNKISVGRIGSCEVDFIILNQNRDYSYVQVARTIDNGNYEADVNLTEEREYRSLESIKDNYPKYLLTMDKLLLKRNGVKHENIARFMADKKDF